MTPLEIADQLIASFSEVGSSDPVIYGLSTIILGPESEISSFTIVSALTILEEKLDSIGASIDCLELFTQYSISHTSSLTIEDFSHMIFNHIL